MKSFPWYHKSNPGEPVLALVEDTEGTAAPVRWMPKINQGHLWEWNSEGTSIIIRADNLEQHIAQHYEAIADAGFFMLDIESAPNAVDHADWIEQARFAEKYATELCPPNTGVFIYPIPRTHVEGRLNEVEAVENASAIGTATHLYGRQWLISLCRAINFVAGKRPVICYLWVLSGAPHPELGFWNGQHNRWISREEVAVRTRELLRLLNNPQIVMRGAGPACAEALAIVRQEILEWPAATASAR